MATVTRSEPAALEYARLLLKQHELDPRGEKNLPELDVICDQMDGPWTRMSGRERKRLKGLSQDLYALADGRKGIPMSAEEHRQWAESGRAALGSKDPDAHLAHLRQPFPQEAALGMIQFLQARSWERLGNLEVALVFMEAAAKTIRPCLLGCLDYLQKIGRDAEAAQLVNSVNYADLLSRAP